MLLEALRITLIGGEEEQEILDTPLLECAGQVLHALLGQERAEDESEDVDGDICNIR